MLPITPDAVRAAHERIRSWIRHTPLLAGTTGDAAFGAGEVIFKLELFQHAGSFKTRGAMNHLLSRTVPAAGVAAASGGNHGVAGFQAVSVQCVSDACPVACENGSEDNLMLLHRIAHALGRDRGSGRSSAACGRRC